MERKAKTKHMSFGELINKKRKEKDWSLYDLSKRVNVEPSYISKLEKGERQNPGFLTVCALAKVLELKECEILNTFGVDSLGV